MAFIIFLVVLAVCAPLVASLTGHGANQPFGHQMPDDFGLPKGPNGEFWMGADVSGRDVMVRIAYGTRVSLAVGLLATAVAVLIGVFLGLAARLPRRVARRHPVAHGRDHPVAADPAVCDQHRHRLPLL